MPTIPRQRQIISKALTQLQSGQSEKARLTLAPLIRECPNSDALRIAANLDFSAGRFNESSELLKRVLALGVHTNDDIQNLLLSLVRANRTPEAIELVHSVGSSSPEVRLWLAKVLVSVDANMDAINLVDTIDAETLKADGLLSDAARIYIDGRRFETAITLLEKHLESAPNDLTSILDLVFCNHAISKFDECLQILDRVDMPLKSEDVPLIHLNKAVCNREVGKITTALAELELARETGCDEDAYYLNLAILEMKQGLFGNASVHLDACIRINSQEVKPLFYKVHCLESLGRRIEAIRLNTAANEMFRNNYKLLMQGVRMNRRNGDVQKAMAYIEKVLKIFPTDSVALIEEYLLTQSVGLFDRSRITHEKLLDRLNEANLQLDPLTTMYFSDDLALNQKMARRHARFNTEGTPESNCSDRQQGKYNFNTRVSGRIKMVLVSGDFHGDHPVGRLLEPLLKHLNKEKFEVHLFHTGVNIDDVTQTLISHSDHFNHVFNSSSDETRGSIRAQNADLAIDLSGYTYRSGTNLFNQRLARLHLLYLGYPGTLGCRKCDFLVADDYVVPRGAERFYDEEILRIEGCFFPLYREEINKDSDFCSRERYGLDEDSIVLCSFQDAAKITEPVFNTWLTALLEVPKTVLWLSSKSAEQAKNYIGHAQSKGVDPDRIKFAERIDNHSSYLERYVCADLFLDTFPYNAHSTARDALVAGVPVITRSGESFASRVSGSMLRHLGLEELIADSTEGYYRILREYASDRDRIASLKARIESQLMMSSSGNNYTTRFERAIERAVNRQ